MNELELFEAVANIDEKYVEEAERHGFFENRRRKRFIRDLACAVGFCIVAGLAAYALSSAFDVSARPQRRAVQQPAVTHAPSSTPIPDLSAEDAFTYIVWNEGDVVPPATRGGEPAASYDSASGSFEFYGGAALPEQIDGECTLKEEPTYILVSNGQSGRVYTSSYSYCAAAEQCIVVTFCYSNSTGPQPAATQQTWCFSSCDGEKFVLGISNDEDSNTVYSAQAVLNVSPSDNDAANDGDHYLVIRSRGLPDGHYCVTPENKLTVGIESVGRISRESFLNAVRTILDSLSAGLKGK